MVPTNASPYRMLAVRFWRFVQALHHQLEEYDNPVVLGGGLCPAR